MLLAIDIGNTNITVGLLRAGTIVAARRAATDPTATADEIDLLRTGLLGLDDATFADVAAIACSSVVPVLTGAIETVAQRRDRPLTIAGPGTVPVPVRVDRPGDVGADRLVNALAASAIKRARMRCADSSSERARISRRIDRRARASKRRNDATTCETSENVG
jgi:type III pantothenate kinase